MWILFSNMKYPFHECLVIFWHLTSYSDFKTEQTVHQCRSWPWYRAWRSPNYEWSICNGFDMPAGNAYPSWHLFRPLIEGGGLACALIDETSFPRLYTVERPYRTWPSPIKKRFLWSICDGCGMPAGSAYPSGHLDPSPYWGLAYAPIVEISLTEFAVPFLDFSPWIPLVTFSILR